MLCHLSLIICLIQIKLYRLYKNRIFIVKVRRMRYKLIILISRKSMRDMHYLKINYKIILICQVLLCLSQLRIICLLGLVISCRINILEIIVIVSSVRAIINHIYIKSTNVCYIHQQGTHK